MILTGGIFFTVDLEYPKELHDIHNDYPLCPERNIVTSHMISKHTCYLMKKADEDMNKKHKLKSDKVAKLICDLNDKVKYGLHYRNLKQCIQLGMILKMCTVVFLLIRSLG